MSLYLDSNATAPLRPEVREAFLAALERVRGNPSSLHRQGREARHLLDEARERVAAALAVHEEEIVFTSGGTESNNLAVLGALLSGIVLTVGGAAWLDTRLNFLNFVALPITFGIGVDYAVNVMRRYIQEVDGGTADPIESAVQETGGAVVVCSLTTIFGYCALLTSANRALNSFGLAAVIGEFTCTLSALLSLSALLVLIERRRSSPRSVDQSGGLVG